MNAGNALHFQSDLNPSYDTLGNYMEMLHRAVSTPHPGYEEMGTHQAGERVQLSTHTLQIAPAWLRSSNAPSG